MSEFKRLNTVTDSSGNIINTEEEVVSKFTREPVIINCKYCKKKILTEVETESTWTGILISFILLIIFNIFGILLIFLVIPLTQHSNHRCSSCLNIIGECNFYDILSLSDKVLSVTIGSFALIISKKVLLGFFVFSFLAITTFYFFINIDTTYHYIIKDTWSDFNKECSQDNYRLKPTTSKANCVKYRYSNVGWNGYVVRVDFSDSFFDKHKVSILVKMNIDDGMISSTNNTNTENNSNSVMLNNTISNTEEIDTINNYHSIDGDLYLKFSEDSFNTNKNSIISINRGDLIQFNATIIHEGDARYVPVLECFEMESNIKKYYGHINIDPHIHHGGRYSLDKKHLEHEAIYNDHNLHVNETLYDDLKDVVIDNEIDIHNQKETFH